MIYIHKLTVQRLKGVSISETHPHRDEDWLTLTPYHLSIKARNLCVCVCVCVCVPQISLRIRLTWWLLLGSRVCQVGFIWTTIILLINYFINVLQIPRALSTRTITVTCAPEPITAELTSTIYLKKRADLYLQRCELDRDFAGSSVPFSSVHLNWLLWINETKRVWTDSVWVWGDLETRGQQSGIGICGCSC